MKKIQVANRVFETKKSLKKYLRELLDSYNCNETVKEKDYDFFSALLAKHPNYIEKIGCGIRRLFINYDTEFGNYKILFIERNDGEYIDVSLNKCLANLNENNESIQISVVYSKNNNKKLICCTCKKEKNINEFRLNKQEQRVRICKSCADKWRETADGRLQTKLDAHCARTNDKFLPVARYKATLEHFNHACAKCGCDHKLHIDHIVPVALGGRTVIENLVPLCEDCNLEKSSKEPVDFFGKEKLVEISSYFEERLRAKNIKSKASKKEDRECIASTKNVSIVEK